MAKRRPRNVQPTPVRIPLRWEVVRNPRTWLESGFSLALLLTPLAFHSATSNSIVVKDFFSAWFFWFFLLMGGLVLYAEKSWRRIPISFAAPFLVYFLYGTIRALTSPYPEHSWASWKLTVFAVAPLIPCFLIAGCPRAGRRAFFFLALGPCHLPVRRDSIRRSDPRAPEPGPGAMALEPMASFERTS
jgi:hypothetical protein